MREYIIPNTALSPNPFILVNLPETYPKIQIVAMADAISWIVSKSIFIPIVA